MISFQYNKTSLQLLEKQLKVRQRTLPIIKNKESALRVEVKKCKGEMVAHDEEYARLMQSYKALFALWNEKKAVHTMPLCLLKRIIYPLSIWQKTIYKKAESLCKTLYG